MKRNGRGSRAPSKVPQAGPGKLVEPPIWDREAYPIIDDGPLLVQAVKIKGPDWCRNLRRWSVLVECAGVEEPVTLAIFLNLAGDESGPGKPGRQSKFYKHWTMANGEPPRKGQRMNFDVFVDKFFMAQVEKVTKDSKGALKPDAEIYSRISHFIRREEM